MENLTGGFLAGIQTTLAFLWDSLFGLIFGFLISAIVQTVATPRQMERWLGPNLRGVLWGAAFGVVSSACSYGAAAAARGFYERGADIRSVFSFLISSTNMNVAILVLFWALLGWKFVAAEFFGGAIIIAVVGTGFSLFFSAEQLHDLQATAPGASALGECPICGMEGEAEHAVSLAGVLYYACGANHEKALRDGALDARENRLWDPATWRVIWQTLLGDVAMLRNELIIGYVIAGFAAALVPAQWLTGALSAFGHVPLIGYPLLLLTGLLLAVLTFVCSMGNVPVARFLALAGIPLGANVTFIYGDLLVLPLIGIYRKSFAPRIVWAFLGLFVMGAMLAGALMEVTIGRGFVGVAAMGSMQFNERFTLVSNIAGMVALLAVWLNYRANASFKAAD